MSNPSFTIKQHDTSPAIVRNLTDENGSPLNLTSATVMFYMADKVAASASILDASAGQVAYEWDAGDTDTAGSFLSEFTIFRADGSEETAPNYGYTVINISKSLRVPNA